MKSLTIIPQVLLVTVSLAIASGQSANSNSKGKDVAATRQRLVISDTVKVSSELAGLFVFPIKCDEDGNLYLKSDTDRVSAVRKFNIKGQRLALFQASSAMDTPSPVDLTTYFSVASDGSLYQLAFPPKGLDRYVLVYNKDGSYKSSIKLRPGLHWKPTQIAVFASGDLLVAAVTYDPESGLDLPFTGIFSSDGSLLRRITFEDDASIEKMAAAGDRRVVPENDPSANFAVEQGTLESGPDGNIYLMRKLSPALVYAISPGGAVVRRFKVDAGDPNYIPVIMHVAKSRIAILFRQPQSADELVKVVDLEGKEVAAYDAPANQREQTLGAAFACYSENPERFTFLTTTEDERLGFKIAEPR